ncbi:MAG: cyclic pyranopterin monophosphate synthase MoaC [Rickettsiales bacterium]|nr:cyclic pyranopterin monophosphate synthase MoaC [Rickettsiales bacterium]OUV80695.1 MAG: cyclic pyranopterin monophosphate synthase MoaC [Rickettsiales bacterium TMED131]|tara:strand:- start:917 stop:1390 length:474 start_codon:yes stop_codon:yes gene_type:complete
MKSTHFDNKGAAKMVDVSKKKTTTRIAKAQGHVYMKKTTLEMIKKGAHKKGDVLAIARIAGIMSTKKTSDLIPLCHPIGVEAVNIEFEINNRSNSIKILSSCKTSNKTGIEIEALMAVSISALTIYDMCKSVDKEMHLDAIMLTHKSGGKSGTFNKK